MRLSAVFIIALSTCTIGVQATDPENCPVFREEPESSDQKVALKNGVRPCGYYESMGCDHPVIPPNVAHPGEGDGDIEAMPYIVQFDIGTHANVLDKVTSSLVGTEFGNCIGCAGSVGDEYELGDNVVLNASGETCLEIIVQAGSDVTGGCAGKCGVACSFSSWDPTTWNPAGYAKDCLKHDVCATYKAVVLNNFNYADGFCHDPDCGDEAATTLMECWEGGWGWDIALICKSEDFDENPDVYGKWTFGSIAMSSEGPCSNFRDWSSGQGIPNRDQIRNPYAQDVLAFGETY